MLTAVKNGVSMTAALDRRRRAAQWLPIRGDPRRDLGPSDRARGLIDLYVNHETSKVPFPFALGRPDRGFNGQSDFDNSQVSQLTLNAAGAGARRLVRHR